jgi:hypothetical protein
MSIPKTTITLYQSTEQFATGLAPVLEFVHGATGSTGGNEQYGPVTPETFISVLAEGTEFDDTAKTLELTWYNGLTAEQIDRVNIYGPTGASGNVSLFSTYYSTSFGATGATSPLRAELYYGLTAQTTSVTISVENPSVIYGTEGLTIEIDSAEDPSGPYTSEWSNYYDTAGPLGIVDVISFPTSKYLRLSTNFPPIVEGPNQTEVQMWRDGVQLVGITYPANYVGLTSVEYVTTTESTLAIKSGMFPGSDLGTGGGNFSGIVTFETPFLTNDYTVSVTSLFEDGTVYMGKTTNFAPKITSKTASDFTWDVTVSDGIDKFTFEWSAIYNGDTGYSTELVNDMTRYEVLPEAVIFQQIGLTASAYSILVKTT